MMWKTFSGKPVSDDLQHLVEKTILRENQQGNKVRICVGTDSRVKMKRINFASVVVVVREKNGGYMFFHKSSVLRSGVPVKERLIMEVGKSVEIAYQIN